MPEKLILKIRRRLNKEVDGKLYWKWYVDIPANQKEIIRRGWIELQ